MKTVLYLGLNVPIELKQQAAVIHCPLIHIQPRMLESADIQKAFADLPLYTHLIFTSKSAVSIFFDYLEKLSPLLKEHFDAKNFIAIGPQTAKKIATYRQQAQIITAAYETAEGVVETLKKLPLEDAYLFWPHSADARPVITDWLRSQKILHKQSIFYDTLSATSSQLPELSSCDEIIFTSPSTVKAFLQAYHHLPLNKKLTCIGPITQSFLDTLLSKLTHPKGVIPNSGF